MRVKLCRLAAAFVLAGLCAVPAAASQARDDGQAGTACSQQHGLFFGPSAVYDTDTSGAGNAGYFCFFYSPAAAAAVPGIAPEDLHTAADLRTNPVVKRVRKLCTAAGGRFYLFEEDHFGEVFDAGWGCRFV